MDKMSHRRVADAYFYHFLQLVQTGKFFRDSASSDSKHRVPNQRALNQSVRSANLRFHSALDAIEIEIVSLLLR